MLRATSVAELPSATRTSTALTLWLMVCDDWIASSRPGAPGRFSAGLAAVRVRFRGADSLSDAEIEAYLHAEQPYDCAGSAKSEGLGITLLDAIDSDDPTALIGLPLIRTSRMLRAALA